MRKIRAAVAIAAVAALVGCATPDVPGIPAPGPTPPPEPDVETAYDVTVLDDGSGAELCLGGIAESYPPQCSGPEIVGWQWRDYEGNYEESGDTRWGTFWVSGVYDPEDDTFTLTDAMPSLPGSGTDEPEDTANDDRFATPCPTPDGGWGVVDAALSSPDDWERAIARAETLDGYAATRVDSSLADPRDDPELEDPLDLKNTILNVALVGDPEPAERELREVWGGMLCVSEADRTLEEMERIQQEVMTSDLLWTSLDGFTGTVEVGVIFDDGALQDEYDATYGQGVVRVDSALIPVD